VDVVLALGDSITAGFGMEGKIGGLHEYRGKSWSIGGDANATTLPNFVKQYNPNVTGYSIGRREVRFGVRMQRSSKLIHLADLTLLLSP
jgi:hypothetical protein